MRLPELTGQNRLLFDAVCDLSREDLLTDSALGFGLTTATPVQRAICRLCDGLPLDELETHPDVISAIGDTSEISGAIREILIISGVRVGKSLWAAMNAFFMGIHCDIEAKNLRAGEIPRATLVSIDRDLAAPLFNHVRYTILNSPALKVFLVKDGQESITIRNFQNWPVEISVVANKKDGATVAARWCAGLIPDEAPRMSGQESIVNYSDLVKSARERLLPGTMVCSIGSPWAPYGPVFDLVSAHWKKPTRNLVVVKCPAWVLNPMEWTPERVEETKTTRPDEYVTECLGEFASPEDSLIPQHAYLENTRETPDILPPTRGMTYRAGIDPAMRGNSWTFVIATRNGLKKQVVLTRQWQGTKIKPLNPKKVLEEIKSICEEYGIDVIYTDQHHSDTLKVIADDMGLLLVQETWTAQKMTLFALDLAQMVLSGQVEFSPDPILRADVLRVVKRATKLGVGIHFPKTADNRHCDYVPSLLLAMSRYIEDFRAQDSRSAEKREADRQEKQMLESAMRRQKNKGSDLRARILERTKFR